MAVPKTARNSEQGRFQLIPKLPDPAIVRRHFRNGNRGGHAHSNNSRYVQRSAPPPILLSPAVYLWTDYLFSTPGKIKSANSFGTIKFMGRKSQKIHFQIIYI